MDVDSGTIKIIARPCSYVDVRWCCQVAYENLTNRKRFMTQLTWDGLSDIYSLLLWKPKDSVLFRPATVDKENNGLTAFQCFWDNDTTGVGFPNALEDPDVLSDLIQSKAIKGLMLEMWKEDYYKRLSGGDIPFFPEETLLHPGMTKSLFVSTFGREPDTAAEFFWRNYGTI